MSTTSIPAEGDRIYVYPRHIGPAEHVTVLAIDDGQCNRCGAHEAPVVLHVADVDDGVEWQLRLADYDHWEIAP